MAEAIDYFCKKAPLQMFYWVLDIKKVHFCVVIFYRKANKHGQSKRETIER